MQLSLANAFKDDFWIGAAVNARTIASQRDLLIAHYNSVTAENEMKFERVHPSEDRFTFEQADAIAAFARMHGMKLRGHTLIWHNQTPAWVFEDGSGGRADKATLLGRMKTHIQTIVGRYRGTAYCWDVVNEAVSDEGDEWLRPSPWLAGAGEDYLLKAFEYAQEADPDAQLFYNDYNECRPVKREKIYRLVRRLLDRGAPVHGIGLQAHWNLSEPSLDDIRSAIEQYASLGLVLQITEMDVSVFDFDDRGTGQRMPDAALLEKQAERYEQFFDLFREYHDVITGVTFWGAADDHTWLDNFPVRGRKNWPLLFDERHRPKPAFQRIVRARSTRD